MAKAFKSRYERKRQNRRIGKERERKKELKNKAMGWKIGGVKTEFKIKKGKKEKLVKSKEET